MFYSPIVLFLLGSIKFSAVMECYSLEDALNDVFGCRFADISLSEPHLAVLDRAKNVIYRVKDDCLLSAHVSFFEQITQEPSTMFVKGLRSRLLNTYSSLKAIGDAVDIPATLAMIDLLSPEQVEGFDLAPLKEAAMEVKYLLPISKCSFKKRAQWAIYLRELSRLYAYWRHFSEVPYLRRSVVLTEAPSNVISLRDAVKDLNWHGGFVGKPACGKGLSAHEIAVLTELADEEGWEVDVAVFEEQSYLYRATYDPFSLLGSRHEQVRVPSLHVLPIDVPAPSKMVVAEPPLTAARPLTSGAPGFSVGDGYDECRDYLFRNAIKTTDLNKLDRSHIERMKAGTDMGPLRLILTKSQLGRLVSSMRSPDAELAARVQEVVTCLGLDESQRLDLAKLLSQKLVLARAQMPCRLSGGKIYVKRN